MDHISAGRTITVSGNGAARGTPDLVLAYLQCSAVAGTVAAAVAESERAVKSVLAALADAGVAAADAVTGGLSVQAQETWDDKGGSRITGYRADHSIQARILALANVGSVLGAVIAAAGDNARLGGLSPQVDDTAALRAAARHAAWDDALASAQQLAALAGATLGNALSVSDGAGGHGEPTPMFAAKAEMGDARLSYNPDDVEVGATVRVTWELA